MVAFSVVNFAVNTVLTVVCAGSTDDKTIACNFDRCNVQETFRGIRGIFVETMPYSYVPRIAVLLALVGISHASSVSMYGQVSMQIDSEGFDGETPFALSGTRVPNTGSDFGSHIIDAQAIVIRPSNFTFWTMPSDDVLDSLASNSTAQETPWVAVISAGSMST